MAEQMRAWQFPTPGPIKTTLKLLDNAPKPSAPLRSGEILVQVEAVSLNPADYKLPELGIAARAMMGFPKTPCMDLSGRVVATGPDVTDVSAGAPVAARLDPLRREGALAQYVVVDRSSYTPLPESLNLYTAAGMPTVGLTAYQCIAPHVKAGDKVFLNGGSGGAGTFGIQIAKALGCHVTVTCSPAKADLCRRLGADDIIDYTATSVTDALRERGAVFALAVDNVGNSPPDLYTHSAAFLQPGAPFIFVGGAVSLRSGFNLAKGLLLPGFLGGGQRKFSAIITHNDRDELATLVGWLDEGKIETVIDSVYDFEQVPEAFAHLKKGSSTGKVIVRVQ